MRPALCRSEIPFQIQRARVQEKAVVESGSPSREPPAQFLATFVLNSKRFILERSEYARFLSDIRFEI